MTFFTRLAHTLTPGNKAVIHALNISIALQRTDNKTWQLHSPWASLLKYHILIFLNIPAKHLLCLEYSLPLIQLDVLSISSEQILSAWLRYAEDEENTSERIALKLNFETYFFQQSGDL